MYPAILERVSNLKQDFPEGFAEEVAQVVKRVPKSYQLASMAFVKEVRCIHWGAALLLYLCCSTALHKLALPQL